MSEVDPALCYLHEVSDIIFCHVVDFLHTDDEYLKQMTFITGLVEEGNFNCIGLI